MKQKKVSVNRKIKGQIVKKVITNKVITENISELQKEELEKKLSECKDILLNSSLQQMTFVLNMKL